MSLNAYEVGTKLTLHDNLDYYKRPIKLNKSIDELNAMQKDREDNVRIMSAEDAATVEISDTAKALYSSSSADKKTVADESAADREIRELEEWIRDHSQVDESQDLLRRNVRLSDTQASAVDVSGLPETDPSKIYTQAFSDAADGFADFSEKITMGDYSSNDVSTENLNFEVLDDMENMYQTYKSQIEADYSGAEKEDRLSKLDDAYNKVYQEKILNPIKGAYDDKLYFFMVDSEETTRSIIAESESMEHLQEMVSNYVTNQNINRMQKRALTEGIKEFYDLYNDPSKWHDTEDVKSVMTKTMDSYSSFTEVSSRSSMYLSAKRAADAIAKTISDKYAAEHGFDPERYGYSQDDENTSTNGVSSAVQHVAGLYRLEFKNIEDLLELGLELD